MAGIIIVNEIFNRFLSQEIPVGKSRLPEKHDNRE
jgi:hypothetical protein